MGISIPANPAMGVSGLLDSPSQGPQVSVSPLAAERAAEGEGARLPSSLLLLLLLEVIDREFKGLSPSLRALIWRILLADGLFPTCNNAPCGLALATGFASANASPCHHATLPLATGFALAYRDGKRWLALATGVALATGLAVSTGFALETAVANVAFFSAAFSTAALAELLNLASSACRRAA